jgi:hypothetical protein
MLTVGNIYRLRFPGIAARVIDPPPGHAPGTHPFLVESLILRSRWYVNGRGEPLTIHTPSLIVPDGSKPARPTRTIMLAAVAIYMAFIPVALWLRQLEPPLNPPPGMVFLLAHPHKLVADGFSYTHPARPLREFEDEISNQQRSPVVIYEDDKPLPLPHSVHADIEKIGLGRYSHWKDIGFVFSTSDNSDPNKNGRLYWAVLPR